MLDGVRCWAPSPPMWRVISNHLLSFRKCLPPLTTPHDMSDETAQKWCCPFLWQRRNILAHTTLLSSCSSRHMCTRISRSTSLPSRQAANHGIFISALVCFERTSPFTMLTIHVFREDSLYNPHGNRRRIKVDFYLTQNWDWTGKYGRWTLVTCLLQHSLSLRGIGSWRGHIKGARKGFSVSSQLLWLQIPSNKSQLKVRPVVFTPGRQRQENDNFESNLVYITSLKIATKIK